MSQAMDEKEAPKQSGVAPEPTSRLAVSKRHPLIGWLKGTVQIAPGVDLTEPADPEWADRLDRLYGCSKEEGNLDRE
jgi:hypothetical protein